MENALYIYLQLRKAGATHEGACGMLGNLQAESGIMPCRVEGAGTMDIQNAKRSTL